MDFGRPVEPKGPPPGLTDYPSKGLRPARGLEDHLSALLQRGGPEVGLVLLSPELVSPYAPGQRHDLELAVGMLTGSALRSLRSDTTSVFHLVGAQFCVVTSGRSRAELNDVALSLYRRSYGNKFVLTACAAVYEPDGPDRATPLTLMLRAWRLVRELGPGVSTEWDGLIEEDGSTGAGVRAPLPPIRPPGHLEAEAGDPRDDPL